MESTIRTLSTAVVASVLTLAVGISTASALSDTERKCLETVAKEGVNFVKKKMKEIQKCNDKNLKVPVESPECLTTDLAASIAALVVSLEEKIDSKCSTLVPFNFASIGYPGKCSQADPGGDFTITDLKNCIHESHEAIVDQLIAIEYGSTVGPIADTALLKCQREIAKNGAKFANAKHKEVAKCRNGVNKGKLFGFAAKNCATANLKTKEKIDKAETKARGKILGKCTGEADELVPQLDICDPPVTTVAEAADCIIETHGNAVDNPDAASPADLIDYEYATQLICGDNVLNSSKNPHNLEEECDDTADDACPGQCGPADGPFPCLCLNKKRQRISEKVEGADSDSGWTGISHDQRVVPGAGYLLDLYDCDGVSDFECIVGPNCNISKALCAKNADCATPGDFCRKERTAAGKHCNLDIQQACASNGDCPGTGNFCVVTPHGPPLPLAAGGVSVCPATFFIDDITGTTNLQTGATVIRLHQETPTRMGPSNAQPCPVCGGFCSGPVNSTNRRTNCTSDADCASIEGSPPCVTDFICNSGPNVDKECRPEPPFGGSNGIFGTTSMDCPSNSSLAGTIDNDFNPATTGVSELVPQYQCDAPGFGNKVCLGGANDGRPCADDSECPGATCAHQCYCPTKTMVGGAGILEKPNDCDPACLGGDNEKAPCAVDSECPGGGFCHKADCRLNPADPEGPDEGVCTVGPVHNLCSQTTYKQCNADADCVPPACSYCQLGETCVSGFRQCFPNSGFSRTGEAGLTDLTLVAAYCIKAIPEASVNSTSGFPGPAGQRYPADRVTTGFPSP